MFACLQQVWTGLSRGYDVFKTGELPDGVYENWATMVVRINIVE
jgi:hypothetical protein